MSADAEPGEDPEARYKERIGQVLAGRWTIDALLGVGGMAAVYAATHKIGRRDAIKLLHPEVSVSRELRARFEQEAHAVNRLQHPGSVQILDIEATAEGTPFLVMELLEGEVLGDRARRAGVSEDELLGYVDALLDVLVAAHALGIVHRDIKPDNLFVTHDGRLKVLDFGIARMKEGAPRTLHTQTGAMIGTIAYMAPEQIHARPVDGRADLYAVGATMFRLLAGRKLHVADSDAELLMKMGTTPAPPLASVAPSVSARVALVVDRALAFQLDERYPDAATMRADVQAVRRGEDPPFALRAAANVERPTRLDAGEPAVAVAAVAATLPDAGPPAAVAVTQAGVASNRPAPRMPAGDERRRLLPLILVGLGTTLLGATLALAWFFTRDEPSSTRSTSARERDQGRDDASGEAAEGEGSAVPFDLAALGALGAPDRAASAAATAGAAPARRTPSTGKTAAAVAPPTSTTSGTAAPVSTGAQTATAPPPPATAAPTATQGQTSTTPPAEKGKGKKDKGKGKKDD